MTVSTRTPSRVERAARARLWTAAGLAALTLAACSGQRIQANEASAIATLRAILSAQFAYAADCNGFAPGLTALGRSGVLSRDLAASDALTHRGYRFTVKSSSPSALARCEAAFEHFEIVAAPEAPGESGTRYFKAGDDGKVLAATAADFANATALE